MPGKVKHGCYLLAEKALRLVIIPSLRAAILRWLGARIGTNVRIHECRFMNLSQGFSNLHVMDDVHIGPDCMIDLEGHVEIGRKTTLAPRVTLLSHSDPGSAHGSELVKLFPPETNGISIGEGCWLGANVTVISGSSIGAGCVVAAMSLVRGELDANAMYAGVPVRKVRALIN